MKGRINRRNFLKTVGTAAAGAMLTTASLPASAESNARCEKKGS